MRGFRGSDPKSHYKFNTPDFAEIGILVTSVKKIQDEINDIKKALV